MDLFRALGKTLFWFGLLFVAIGVLLMAAPKLPLGRLGRLPGDIVVQRKNFTVYLPLATSLVLSVALTLVFWVLSLFSGKK